jgi:CheY-like chemotaxis protein
MNSKSAPYRPVVMVVDDETVIADTLSTILRNSGYSVVTTYDGEAALEAALDAPPGLIISDVMLPGMNGIELGITIRRIFPDCKVILFSGQSHTPRLLSLAGEAGHTFICLQKPVHPALLMKQVEDCLQSGASLTAA